MAKKSRPAASSTKRRVASSTADPTQVVEVSESEASAAEKAPKAKSRAKATKTAKTSSRPTKARRLRVDASHPRLKAYWAVCNQMMNVVTLFEYGERKAADTLAEELTESKKSTHFVQIVKRTVEE